MYVTEPDPKIKRIDDYDFTFASFLIPVSIDKEAGDTITTEGTLIHIHLVPKPSPIDPSITLPEEDLVIYTTHLLTMHHKVKEVQEQTTAQKLEWHRTIQEIHPTIQ